MLLDTQSTILSKGYAAYINELSLSSFVLNLGFAFRGLWAGAFSRDEFYQQMVIVLERGIMKAFEEGFAEMGIMPDDMKPDETKYKDKSLIQQLHGVPPRVFHIEGIK